jgi:hypothetical protein
MLTRDDVIRMAREADPAGDAGKLVYLAEIGTGTLERFAAAAYAAGAAAEREACALLCEGDLRTARQGAARQGPEGAGAWYEGSPMHRVTQAIAAAIRQRGAA